MIDLKINENKINHTTYLEWLSLLFIYLKLTHQIDWHWIIVLSPLLLPLVVAALCLAGIGVNSLLKTPSDK